MTMEAENVPTFAKKRPKQQNIPTSHLMVLFACADDLSPLELSGVVGVVQETSARMIVSFESPEQAVVAAERLRGCVSKNLAVEVQAKPMEVFFATSSEDEKQLKVPSCLLGVMDVNKAPPGLVLKNNLVTEEEEAALVAFLDGQPWEDDIKRRVQHYGYAFDYTTRSVNPSFAVVKPIPAVIRQFFSRMNLPFEPDQITVNEYVPGVGIKPHIDTHSAFTDGIASLSLLSAVSFDMRRDSDRFSLGIPARSLLLMTGEARYAWAHAIAARRTDVFENELVIRQRRLSLTLRQVRPVGSECRCDYPAYCDSQSSVLNAPVSEIERNGVVNFYNRIANHFSQTRHTPWPRVTDFVLKSQPFDAVLDVGCGNGRHLLPARESDTLKSALLFGCDIIPRFVQIAKDRKLEVLRCDAVHLPYRSSVFDRVLCVAVIHHLASEERRLHVLEELLRVTRLKGVILVTAWAFEQTVESKRKFDAQDVAVPWVLPASHDPTRVDEVELAGDVKSIRKLPPVSVDRYCHVFIKGELEELVSRLGNKVQIVDSYYDQANWACIFKKVSL